MVPRHFDLAFGTGRQRLARKSLDQAIARAMPPATAGRPVRWDIRQVPRCFPPDLEFESDSEERAYQEEQQRQVKKYVDHHSHKGRSGGDVGYSVLRCVGGKVSCEKPS